MYNNPYGPRKSKPPLEGLEARFNALPSWGRFGLIGLSALVTIASGVVTIVLVIVAVSPPQQSVAAQPVTVMATLTPMATLASTSTPATPTPALTPTPEQQQASQPGQPQQPASTPLFVTITNAFATDYGPGSVSVNTLPGAALTISVRYCTGSYADSKSLKGTVYAGPDGNYTWLWEPETKCRGAATAYVNASLNGQSVSTSTTFTVS